MVANVIKAALNFEKRLRALIKALSPYSHRSECRDCEQPRVKPYDRCELHQRILRIAETSAIAMGIDALEHYYDILRLMK